MAHTVDGLVETNEGKKSILWTEWNECRIQYDLVGHIDHSRVFYFYLCQVNNQRKLVARECYEP